MPTRHRQRPADCSARICAWLLLLALAGCTSGARRPAAPAPEQQALQLANSGDFRAAADAYLTLAEAQPARAREYRLEAAGLLLDAGDADAARRLAQAATPGKPGSPEALQLDLLRARFALTEGRPADALGLLSAGASRAPAALQARRLELRAEAQEMAGDQFAAALDRIRLAAFARGDRADRDNLLRLWASLNAAGADRLRMEAADADPELRDWVGLALLNLEHAADPSALRAALTAWMESHPAHPAIPVITDAVLAESRRFDAAPRRIALLLPFSGQFAAAAAAIRDGLLSAWYADRNFQPEIRIYDTGALNVVEQYRQALADGAQFVIGPLEKPAIAALVEAQVIAVPTLALNRLDGPGAAGALERPNLIQFALSPEDEARQAAQRAIFEGRTRALLVAPLNEWGRRLAGAFREEWLALGGVIVEQVDYEPQLNDFSEVISELLNIDSSEARARQLRERLARRLEYGARMREDADVVFMAALPVAARQILPVFRYYGADFLPVYSSSHAYAGSLDPQSDADMNGLYFPDMPWVLRPDSAAEQAVARNWSGRESGLRRLYAFGVDALRLIPELGRLVAQPGAMLDGATGMLLVGRDAIIQRRLSWARIVNGAPRLIDRGPGG